MGVGSLYRLAVVGQGGLGQELVCTFHYRQLTAESGVNGAEDLVNAWYGNMASLWADTFASSNIFTLLEARGITDPTEGFDLPVSPAVAGTRSSGEPLPPQSAAVITWSTGLIGRRYRGRNYLWYTMETDQSQGTWTAGYQTAMDDFAAANLYIAGAPSWASFDLMVYSKPNPDLDPPWGGAITPVTSYIIRTTVNTQRRRKIGVGS